MIDQRAGMGALHSMRTRRRRHRVADLEWFEALYRVYLAAFLGGWALLFLSDLASDDALSAASVADVRVHGPAVLGLVVAVAVHLGMTSGANGGPLSVEEAEVRHVLLAPLPHAGALRRPLVQRLRSMCFAGALAGGVAGQLLGRRIPSSGGLAEWSAYGAAAGAATGALVVAVAVLAHASRTSRWILSTISLLLLAWQAASIDDSFRIPGPFDGFGSLALWGLGVHAVDVAALAVVPLLVLATFPATSRMSLESLSRRSALVTQMRFAVTLQDVRTVVLLRRQLSAERPRRTPWLRVRSRGRDPVVVRGLRGIVRFPARRIVRTVAVAIAGAACLIEAWRGSTPFVALAGVLFFLLGLELLEPLSQQIDQADATDSLPLERGILHVRHFVAPSIAAIPFVVIVAAAGTLAREGGIAAAVGVSFAVASCSVAAGIAGAAINIVKGAPDPASDATQGLALPPEVSGMGTVLRTAWPPAVAVLGSLPVVALRETHANGDPLAPVAIRAVIAVGVLVSLVGAWTHRRDAIRRWFDTFASGGPARDATPAEEGTSHGNR